MTKAQGYIDVRVIFNLSFEFLLDPVQNEYVLATTAVTVGGAVDASKPSIRWSGMCHAS